MLIKRLTGCALALFVIVLHASATGDEVPAGTVRVELSRYADSSSSFGPHEVLARDRFVTCEERVPNLGITDATNWFLVNVHNRTTDQELFLSVPYPDIDELDVYRVDGKEARSLASMGQARDGAGPGMADQDFTVSVNVPQNGSEQFLIRVKGHKQIHLPVTVTTARALSRNRAFRDLIAGAFVGILMVLAVYNLFVYFSIRDKAYLVYVLYVFVNSIAQLTVMGTAQNFIWQGNTWLSVHASVLCVLLSISMGIAFSLHFIRTAQHVPKLHRLYPLFYIAIAFNLFVYLGVDQMAGYKMAQGISGFSTIYLITMAVLAARNGSRPAKFFLLAWTFFLSGVMAFVLRDAGVLPFNDITTYAMPMGAVLEGVLLSFGLADRINILRKEKERSQADALAASEENARITRDQNIILEQKVTERTHQLQESLDQLKQTQSKLVEAEKMSSLGQLTAGIAHEINNPVNYIRSNIAPLKRDMQDLLDILEAYRAEGVPEKVAEMEDRLGINETITEVNDILRSMEEGADRTAEIVRGLRTFSRLDEGDLKAADINEGIRSTLNILGPQLKDRVLVSLDLRASEAVECYPGKLNQVFMNVLNNAVQAVIAKHGSSGGHIAVVTEQAEEHLMITIADNGIGMKDDVRARVFEPFFTTKAVGEGTGLGLSIAHSIIDKHNGRIEVDSIHGEGSEFRIVLPNRQPMAVAKRA